jgi:hypothetical protein
MPSLRRGYKRRTEKRKPEVVTGGFELHYEDVVNRNRFALIALFASGLVLLAAFIPSAVYQSVAEPDQISVEAEAGTVINPELVTLVEGDVTASENTYIEFRLVPEQAQQ